MIITAHYTAMGEILATIDGVVVTVPDDPANQDREAIHKWVAGGGVIAPYEPATPQVPTSVSARQFKLQLEIQGLTLSVETWVAAQSKLVRIAYANSGRFDLDEPMLQAGFKALGFTDAALDAFYVEAAKL